jgi:phage-related tail fiber protein
MALYLSNINLTQNELQNAKIQALSADPTVPTPVAGQIYFNTSAGRLKIYDGSSWRFASGLFTNDDISGSASIALSKLAVDPLDRANHTGTQTASTISDFDTQVRTSRLDQMAAPTASVSLNTQKITNLLDPTDAQDAATKAYVDATSQGLDVKASVKVATTANITLSGTQTIDGVALSAGARVLVKNQSDGEDNGIYVVAAGVWGRSPDADTDAKVTSGMFTFVEEGTANDNSGWVLTTNGVIVLGTTPLAFAQFSGAGQITAGDGLTKTGNTLDVGGTTDRITVGTDSVDIASTYVGQSSITTLGTIGTGTWEATDVAVAHGGTGASDAAGAKTNLGFITRYAASVGDGSTTSFTVTHNLGTRDVVVQIRENAGSYEYVNADVAATTDNTLTVAFAVAPTTNAYRVIVTG